MITDKLTTLLLSVCVLGAANASSSTSTDRYSQPWSLERVVDDFSYTYADIKSMMNYVSGEGACGNFRHISYGQQMEIEKKLKELAREDTDPKNPKKYLIIFTGEGLESNHWMYPKTADAMQRYRRYRDELAARVPPEVITIKEEQPSEGITERTVGKTLPSEEAPEFCEILTKGRGFCFWNAAFGGDFADPAVKPHIKAIVVDQLSKVSVANDDVSGLLEFVKGKKAMLEGKKAELEGKKAMLEGKKAELDKCERALRSVNRGLNYLALINHILKGKERYNQMISAKEKIKKLGEDKKGELTEIVGYPQSDIQSIYNEILESAEVTELVRYYKWFQDNSRNDRLSAWLNEEFVRTQDMNFFRLNTIVLAFFMYGPDVYIDDEALMGRDELAPGNVLLNSGRGFDLRVTLGSHEADSGYWTYNCLSSEEGDERINLLLNRRTFHFSRLIPITKLEDLKKKAVEKGVEVIEISVNEPYVYDKEAEEPRSKRQRLSESDDSMSD